jgi:hypothetical protein
LITFLNVPQPTFLGNQILLFFADDNEGPKGSQGGVSGWRNSYSSRFQRS